MDKTIAENEKLRKQKYLKTKKEENDKLKNNSKIKDIQFVKTERFFKRTYDKTYTKYKLAIDNKYFFEDYIKKAKEKQELKQKILNTMRLCLQTDFFLESETKFLTKCNQLYKDNIFNLLSNYDNRFKNKMEFVLGEVAKNHIYYFYSLF